MSITRYTSIRKLKSTKNWSIRASQESIAVAYRTELGISDCHRYCINCMYIFFPNWDFPQLICKHIKNNLRCVGLIDSCKGFEKYKEYEKYEEESQ